MYDDRRWTRFETLELPEVSLEELQRLLLRSPPQKLGNEGCFANFLRGDIERLYLALKN